MCFYKNVVWLKIVLIGGFYLKMLAHQLSQLANYVFQYNQKLISCKEPQ